MLETYRLILLRYLLNINDLVGKNEIKIDGIPDNYLPTVVNSLIEDKIVFNSMSHIGINNDGRDYLIRTEVGESNNKSVSVHIGHNINGDIQRSDLKINFPSAPQKSKNAQTKYKPSIVEVIYWIGGIVTAAILAYEFIFKHMR